MNRTRLEYLREKQKEVNAERARKMESVEKLMEVFTELMEKLAENGWSSMTKFRFSSKYFLNLNSDRWLHMGYNDVGEVHIVADESKLRNLYTLKIQKVVEDEWGKAKCEPEVQWYEMFNDIYTWVKLSGLRDLIQLTRSPESFEVIFFGKEKEEIN